MVSEDILKKQLKSEYAMAYDFIRNKRTKFAQYNKDYANIGGDKNTVYVRLIFAVVQTLLSIHYSDKMTAEFNARKISSDDIASNIQNLSEFDHDEMGREEANYWILFDTLMYGSSFEIMEGWDKNKLTPTMRIMNPQMTLMSPNSTNGKHSFYQFEAYIDAEELLAINIKNKAQLKESIENLKNNRKSDNSTNEQDTLKSRLLNMPYNDGKVLVSTNFNIVGGKKYYSLTALGHEIVLDVFEIEPVMEEEKKDNKYIDFPVIQYQFRPVARDSFGLCVGDLLSDKQRAQQILQTIDLVLAQQQAFGDMFLVNSNKVKISHLVGPKPIGPRYIPVDLKQGEKMSLNDVAIAMPKAQLSQDSQVVKQQLAQQAKLDIGIDERTIGVSGDSSITATENQRLQMNANLRQMLNTKVFMRGVKKFWKLWYRSYYANFSFSDEKNIRLNSQFGMRPITVKRKDITTVEDIDIQIIAKSDQEAKKTQDKVSFYTILQLMLPDPMTPNICKIRAKRKYARLNGLDQEEVKQYFPLTPEEVNAMLDLEMINNNELPSITSANEDHMTYILVYARAIDTPAKYAALDARWKLYSKKGMVANTQQGDSTIMNQMTNAMIQKEGNAAESLYGVAQNG